MGLIRDDEADIRVSIDGKPYFEAWSTYDGGDLTAASNKTRTGGMGKQRAIGGPAERSDITCTIQFDDVVAGFHNELESKVGNGDASVSIQFLNPDRTVIPGAHFTRTGKLGAANLPKSDSDGTGAQDFYTIVIHADELAS